MDGRVTIVFNPIVKNNPIELIGVLMKHESLHVEDTISGIKEEIIACALETIAYLKLIGSSPIEKAERLVSGKTSQSLFLNTLALALLNSGGQRGTIGGIKKTPGQKNVLPEGRFELESFEELITRMYPDLPNRSTPGNKTLDIWISEVVGKKIQGLDFDDDTIEILDKHINCFTEKELMQILNVLQLRSNIE